MYCFDMSDYNYVYRKLPIAIKTPDTKHVHYHEITFFTPVGNLNSQKYDGYKGTYSDHFVYASHKYLVVLSMLMNGMLVHG